jgi:hypothetical protein
MVGFVSLPTWNIAWEKPDPLRGRRGWAYPHYVSAMVAVTMSAITFGLMVPALGNARAESVRVRTIDYRHRQVQLAYPYGDWFYPSLIPAESR